MPEFDRTAACLAELSTMDDDTTAQIAEIAFVTQNDYGVLADLRKSIAAQYSAGHVERRDRWRVAGDVGTDVAGQGDQLPRFAAVTDIEYPRLDVGGSFDPGLGTVPVSGDATIGQVVESAVRTRLAMAAHALLTYLEDYADDKEADHEDTDG
jgi:hypothetical protein